MDFSVIKTGGKQYIVQTGKPVTVEKIDGATGDTVKFSDVLMTSTGGTINVGTPTTGDTITGEIIIQKKTKKVFGLKWKNKTRSSGTPFGHRQPMTVVRIK
jgi:large subunit ribosomal protein L21